MSRKYPSPADIEEMKARGYDITSINEAVGLEKRGQRAQEIKEMIRQAFAGVELGQGVGLFEAQGLDDYASEETCAAYRAGDEKKNWRAIPVENLNRCYSSLCFFDEEGMRFHLPAYLIADLNGEYEYGMAFTLTQSMAFSDKFTLLNEAQRSAVRSFIEFIGHEPDYEFDGEHIRNALSGYWSR